MELYRLEDLILVKKMSRADILKNTRTGRPARTTFALRNYNSKGNCMLALPSDLYQDGDKAEFYMSGAGFAIQLSPEGSRLLTGKKNTRTASIPKEVRDRMVGMPEGSIELVPQVLPDRTYFFPFSQLLQQ
jgi:hypothetical protein